MSYAGRKVFITGGSAGIGQSVAIKLAADGADVTVCARGQSKLDETVEAMQAAGGRAGQVLTSAVADVTDTASLEKAANRAIEAMGGVDLLIANAGYAECAPVADAEMDHFRRLMEVNYFGQVSTVQAFLPHFAEQKRGDIILVSSLLAVYSVWGYGAYSASKFALRGFAEALRQELLLHGVRVKLFLPPTTDTPGLAKENEDKPPITLEMETGSSFNKTHSAEEVAGALLSWIPKKRFIGYVGLDSWFQYWAYRHFPNLSLKIADGEMRGAVKRCKEKGLDVQQ